MPAITIWTIFTHLTSVIAFTNATVAFVKAVIAAKGMPASNVITDFLEGVKGIFDSGLIPLTTEEQAGLDGAITTMEAQFKK